MEVSHFKQTNKNNNPAVNRKASHAHDRPHRRWESKWMNKRMRGRNQKEDRESVKNELERISVNERERKSRNKTG